MGLGCSTEVGARLQRAVGKLPISVWLSLASLDAVSETNLESVSTACDGVFSQTCIAYLSARRRAL